MKNFFLNNFGKVKTLFAIFGLNLFWLLFISIFLKVIYSNHFLITFFSACILAPIWEEYIFRYLPFKFLNLSKYKDQFLIPMILGSNILFGLAHGGPINILIQGVGGLFLSYLYFKYESFWLNVLSHALWNFFILFGLIKLI